MPNVRPDVATPLTAALALILALPAGVVAQARPAPADLILTDARVWTVDPARPRARAVAVRGDRVVFVGSEAEAAALRGPSTRVLDLDGKAVYPGFIDSHGHFPGLGTALRTVDLVGTRSYEEMVARVGARASQVPPGRWVEGRGWDQNEWADTRFPHHEALSRAVPDHPVILTRVDGHAVFVNRRALELAGIDRSTPDPEGGRIVRDPGTGEAIGVLVDNAMGLVRSRVPGETREETRAGLVLAQDELNRYGLTTIGDAGSDLPVIGLYEDMARAGELTVRVHAMVNADEGPGSETLRSLARTGPRADVAGAHFLSVRALKVHADGALGSRGAALLEPYADEAGNTGLVKVGRDRLVAIAVWALENGFQLNVHAIGDRMNRIVLDAFEAALDSVPAVDHRFRVEHAQILHRHDIPRFAELGVIPSMQAIHQASDMAWAESRLGWTRLLGSYAWRSLLNTGVVIAGGSDFPVESPDPLLSFHAAVTRQNADGWPAGGWFPEQALTREEALRHLTIWGAYAAFMEDVAGSLTPGKLADIVVFDRDLMTVPADEILDARVAMTIVGGKVVYERTAGDAAAAAAPDSAGR